ncbi:MAG: hypothetical protein MJ219_01900 [Mycoplasmoidaceae bacterium]|nr:hypothetical protein [Mycoplasmoidaceae bacterium]
MKAAGDCVFDELKHVKNIAFEYDGAINEPNLHISANAFKGNTTHGELPTTIVRCIDLSKLTNLEKFSADIGAFVDFQRPKNDGGVLCLLKRGIAAHDKDNFADQLGNAGLKD